jgi:hypothetical protein
MIHPASKFRVTAAGTQMHKEEGIFLAAARRRATEFRVSHLLLRADRWTEQADLMQWPGSC